MNDPHVKYTLASGQAKPVYVRLQTPNEFSFDEILAYLTRSPDECLYHVENRQISRLLVTAGPPLLMSITSSLPRQIDIHFPAGPDHLPESLLTAAVQYVWDWFDLATDLRPFYAMARADELLREVIDPFYGLRIVAIPDLFEALCWAIVGQQINLRFAYTLKRRLIESFGTSMAHNERTYWLFPTAARIASLSPTELTSLQFSQRKAEYVIGVAEHMATGELTKQNLLAMSDFAAMKETLMRIRGVGHWTANYVALRCLKDPVAFPIADVGLHNAIKQQLALNRKPTLEELRELEKHWGRWAAYATFYLWRSLQGLSA